MRSKKFQLAIYTSAFTLRWEWNWLNCWDNVCIYSAGFNEIAVNFVHGALTFSMFPLASVHFDWHTATSKTSIADERQWTSLSRIQLTQKYHIPNAAENYTLEPWVFCTPSAMGSVSGFTMFIFPTSFTSIQAKERQLVRNQMNGSCRCWWN